MNKFLTTCAATAAACLLATSALAFNVVNAFHANTANASCPAPGAKDVGRYKPNTEWCAAYLHQAVIECNAGCTKPFKPASCLGIPLNHNIIDNAGGRVGICHLEQGQQPVTVQACIDEWADYAANCPRM